MALLILLVFLTLLPFTQALGQDRLVSFQQRDGCLQFSNPTIVVDDADWPAVKRAANGLATDFGGVTGHSTTPTIQNATIASNYSHAARPTILVGTIGRSSLIGSLVNRSGISVSHIGGQWEAFQTQLLTQNNASSLTLVIIGSDKRGSVYGLYDISEQIDVSPFRYSTTAEYLHGE